MKKDLGPKLALYPTPLYLVATYDLDGKANMMSVGWGGVCNSRPPCVSISVRPFTHTYTALMERKAFTLNIATEHFTKEVAYCGRVSGKRYDKFKETGLTPIKSEFVEAPYIEEFPISLECKIIQVHEIGSHTQFIGQILNAKIDDEVADLGPSIMEVIKPIVYAIGDDFTYYSVGSKIE